MQLAIETTGRQGSIAILDADRVLDSMVLPSDHRTTATLVPAIERLVESHLSPSNQPPSNQPFQQGIHRGIDFISVASGPGSFTGLRIGGTTAKTLSYAWGIPLVSVNSLAAIAAVAFDQHDEVDRIVVAIDAYRRQVYHGEFLRDELLDPRSNVVAMPQRDFIDLLASHPSGTCFAGDAKLGAGHPGKWLDRVGDRGCDAVGVGLLGWQLAKKKQWTDAMAWVPHYLKPSAAEEQASAVSKNSLSQP